MFDVNSCHQTVAIRTPDTSGWHRKWNQADEGITADYSCRPQPPVCIVDGFSGIPIKIDHTNPLTRKFGKPMDRICEEEGGRVADAYFRTGARWFGLPVNNRAGIFEIIQLFHRASPILVYCCPFRALRMQIGIVCIY